MTIDSEIINLLCYISLFHLCPEWRFAIFSMLVEWPEVLVAIIANLFRHQKLVITLFLFYFISVGHHSIYHLTQYLWFGLFRLHFANHGCQVPSPVRLSKTRIGRLPCLFSEKLHLVTPGVKFIPSYIMAQWEPLY